MHAPATTTLSQPSALINMPLEADSASFQAVRVMKREDGADFGRQVMHYLPAKGYGIEERKNVPLGRRRSGKSAGHSAGLRREERE